MQQQNQAETQPNNGVTKLFPGRHQSVFSNQHGRRDPVDKKQNVQTQKDQAADFYQDYQVICKVIEAQLSKDQSTFFSQMSVFCEVRFKSTEVNLEEISPQKFKIKAQETNKVTATSSGKNPQWQEIFNFNYQKLTKQGQRQFKVSQQKAPELKENIQQLDFILFKKTMLFTSEKIGETTVQLHNASSGSQTDWLILTNENDEIVGKLLAYIEIKRDNTSKEIKRIQKDANLQDKSINDSMLSGMKRDMTEDKGMPLRNHEQVLLLNDGSEPQTQITHQTQHENSSMIMGMGILQMGAIATQHIREEYGEEDSEDDDEDGERGLGYSGIELVGDQPIAEGGGATSVKNTTGNVGYQSTANTGIRNTINHTMAVGEVVLSSQGVSRFQGGQLADEDDESNINSDEQDEYLENTNIVFTRPQAPALRYDQFQQVRPNTAQGTMHKQFRDIKYDDHQQNQRQQAKMVHQQQLNHYQSHEQIPKGLRNPNHLVYREPQNQGAFTPNMQRDQQMQYIMPKGNQVKSGQKNAIPRGPAGKSKKALFQNQMNDRANLNSQSINIRTFEVEPSQKRSSMKHQSSIKAHIQQNSNLHPAPGNIGQFYSQTEIAERHPKYGRTSDFRDQQNMNIGQIDDADLLQNQSQEQQIGQNSDSYEDPDYYAVNSEGNEDNYPEQHQPVQHRGLRQGTPTKQAHYQVPNSRSVKQQYRQNQHESQGSDFQTQKYHEEQTFSHQQHETYQHSHEADMPLVSHNGQIFYPSSQKGIFPQGNHPRAQNYNSELHQQQNSKSLSKGHQNSRAQTQHHNDHTVIQHLTSHSSLETDGYDQQKQNKYIQMPTGQSQQTFKMDERQTRHQSHQGQVVYRGVNNSGVGSSLMPSKQISQLPGQPIYSQDHSSILKQYNSYQEYEDFLNNQENEAIVYENQMQQRGSNQKPNRGGQTQYTSSLSMGVSSGDLANLDPLQQMAQMNSRAMNHEQQLNQMHKNIIHQFEKIKKERTNLKQQKSKLKELNNKLQDKQKHIEEKAHKVEKMALKLKREKIIVINEMSKIKRVFATLQQITQNSNSPVIKEELSSVKVILELLLNDREMFRQEQSIDLDMEKNTAQFNESEQLVHSDQNRREDEGLNFGNQAIHQYQLKLESLCNIYQAKLDEMNIIQKPSQALQNPPDQVMNTWLNMQEMNSQMRTQMEQLTHIQSQMASQMHHVQGLVINQQDISATTSQNMNNFAHSPLINPSTYIPSPLEVFPSQNNPVFNNILPQSLSMPIESNQASSGHFEASHCPIQVSYQQQEEHLSQSQNQDNEKPQDSQHHSYQQQVNPIPENEEQKQQKGASSSSSEFVFNPDPDFLKKINQNIRVNNQVQENINVQQEMEPFDDQGNQSQEEEFQQEYQSEHELEDEHEDDYYQNLWIAAQQEQNDKMIQEQQEEQEEQEDQNQHESPDQVEENQDERNELISNCESDIQIEEEKLEHFSPDQNDQNAANIAQLTAHEQSFVQNITQGKQGEFKDTKTQMSVFQSIQQKLMMINQQNNQNSVQTTDSNPQIPSQLREPMNSMNGSPLETQFPLDNIQDGIYARPASIDQQLGHKNTDSLLPKATVARPVPEALEDEGSSLYDDYYHNEEEQSIVYDNEEKVFDEPKRAKYGIKKSGKLF